jgi:single-strand DNA-binding protein
LTEWHNIVIWNNLASVVERFVKKGDRLYQEGKIRNRSYESQAGEKKYITEIVATAMQMLTPKSGESSKETAPEPEYHETENPYVPREGDLPF